MRKMKIYAISYSDDNYSMSKKLNLITAKLIGGADFTISYGPNDLEEEFIIKNQYILKKSRGAGYWMWKPYIMLKTLERLEYGDYLIYTDAGLVYVNKITEMIRQLERDKADIFLSYGFAPCKDWTKRDAFILMDCDCEEAYNSIMVSGGYVLVKKSHDSIAFLKKWLMYASDRRIITDDPNECGMDNLKGFREHRHDQSILSLLAWKYGISPYKAVSCVDEPRTHRAILYTHVMDPYRYTFNQRLEYIYNEHQEWGYKNADYSRIFINTRIKNTGYIEFIIKLYLAICEAVRADKWGRENDAKYLEKVEIRRRRNKNNDNT